MARPCEKYVDFGIRAVFMVKSFPRQQNKGSKQVGACEGRKGGEDVGGLGRWLWPMEGSLRASDGNE